MPAFFLPRAQQFQQTPRSTRLFRQRLHAAESAIVGPILGTDEKSLGGAQALSGVVPAAAAQQLSRARWRRGRVSHRASLIALHIPIGHPLRDVACQIENAVRTLFPAFFFSSLSCGGAVRVVLL